MLQAGGLIGAALKAAEVLNEDKVREAHIWLLLCNR